MNEREMIDQILREAIAEHIHDNGMVTAPAKLIDRILSRLGLDSQYTHREWTIRRVPGDSAEWKGHRLRGANKASYGYIATHRDGRRETFEPTDGIAPDLGIVRKSLDRFDAVHAVEGR